MKIANADKLIHHFENTVDVKLFTVPEIVTIIKSFSVDINEDNQIKVFQTLTHLFGFKKPGIDNKLLSEEQISEGHEDD